MNALASACHLLFRSSHQEKIQFASHFVPRRKTLWVFGAWQGRLYGDNPKYMFEYVNRNHPEIEAVWISRESSVVDHVRFLGFRAENAMSREGKRLCLRAGAGFMSEGLWDLCHYCLGGAKKIQLWHGMAFKRIQGYRPFPAHKWGVYPYDYSRMEWMTTSPEAVTHFGEGYRIPENQLHITGFPRLDVLANGGENPHFEALKTSHPGQKLVVYMPTHRNFGKNAGSYLTAEQLENLNRLLAEHNILMIFKPHFHELSHYAAYGLKLSHIILATDSALYGDVYSYLQYADAMVADYSSVIFDYACLDRPVVLYPYDLEEYEAQDMGLYVPYRETATGPICKSWEEVVSQLERQFEHDEWKETRNAIRRRIHQYNDGRNCERVFDCVCRLLRL